MTALTAGLEASGPAADQAAGELAAHLLAHPDSAPLAGAELVVSDQWLGLRSHPRPIGTVTYGGPAIPDWLDGSLREIVGATGPLSLDGDLMTDTSPPASSTPTSTCGTPPTRAGTPTSPWRPSHGGTGDAARMNRRFDVETYRAESAEWNVEKFVNVAAATGPNSVEETIELDRTAEANGGPDAIVGGLPPTDTVADAVALLDRQMTAPRFRGVRPMGPLSHPVPDPAVLGALQERNLVFELMTHPDLLATAAAELTGFDDLTIVVEHTGWPRSDSDEEFALWRTASTPWPPSATTSSASSPAWPCRWAPCGPRPSPPGSSTPSRCSAPLAACSPATSPSTPWPAPSTSSTTGSPR